MSYCAEAASAATPHNPLTDARAARLAKFEREQLIVGYLNRGVSVAEIAARMDVSEKRMRAIIREILARRMPAPPEELVAIQVSSLNEALLVAYSAMTDANLKAVDRVVKIVRELDRYHGFCAAQRRLPEPSHREAPVEGTAAFGGALVCRAEFPKGDVIARSPQGDVAIQGGVERPAASGSPRFARDDGESPAPLNPLFGRYDRPEKLLQAAEEVESAGCDSKRCRVGSVWMDSREDSDGGVGVER